MKKQVALCILDGWGLRSEVEGNAVALAKTPNFDRLMAHYPNSKLITHGEAVGLPPGSIGNSEVGHLHIGAGRVILMEVQRINQAIKTGEFGLMEPLVNLARTTRDTGNTVHVVGIVSDVGVHGLNRHLVASVKSLASYGVKVKVHAITDGRDAPPGNAGQDIKRLVDGIEGLAELATISGRYFAMDRDHRWERIKKAWDAIMMGQGLRSPSGPECVEESVARGETDEFIQPTCIGNFMGMKEGDGLFFVNFRSDRMRELSASLADPDFVDFDVTGRPAIFRAVSMANYFTPPRDWIQPLFKKTGIKNTLGEWVARHGLTQMRIAETEKFPHVTFFLNGGKEAMEEGENRFMPNSPKVATYDLEPEMSVREVARGFKEAVNKGFDLIVVNIANPDMVGHTGSLDAAIKACEATDEALGIITEEILAFGGKLIVTADHGNCEMMVDEETGGVHTAHTTNPVPVILVSSNKSFRLRDGGSLIDLAPTLLDLLGLNKPEQMTGNTLIYDVQTH
ncbi:MAG: 2,3-bisphosphoglycerate-independent phosphoglycerate mutase [Rhodobacteraceae bacterium]|nr:2,3-bisphosphoglycerate-independent phosphoglycerate mutase [Paracoccaceae bacterium]